MIIGRNALCKPYKAKMQEAGNLLYIGLHHIFGSAVETYNNNMKAQYENIS